MIAILAWFALFCKDCFGGASAGKRIIGIQVIDANTGQIASPLKCVFRNLFYFLTFVECIAMYYSSNGLRIGDYASHTKVILYNKALQSPKLSQSILAIGYALIGLLLFELFYYFRASYLDYRDFYINKYSCSAGYINPAVLLIQKELRKRTVYVSFAKWT